MPWAFAAGAGAASIAGDVGAMFSAQAQQNAIAGQYGMQKQQADMYGKFANLYQGVATDTYDQYAGEAEDILGSGQDRLGQYIDAGFNFDSEDPRYRYIQDEAARVGRNQGSAMGGWSGSGRMATALQDRAGQVAQGAYGDAYQQWLQGGQLMGSADQMQQRMLGQQANMHMGIGQQKAGGMMGRLGTLKDIYGMQQGAYDTYAGGQGLVEGTAAGRLDQHSENLMALAGSDGGMQSAPMWGQDQNGNWVNAGGLQSNPF